jgi:hypothetical protein
VVLRTAFWPPPWRVVLGVGAVVAWACRVAWTWVLFALVCDEPADLVVAVVAVVAVARHPLALPSRRAVALSIARAISLRSLQIHASLSFSILLVPLLLLALLLLLLALLLLLLLSLLLSLLTRVAVQSFAWR